MEWFILINAGLVLFSWRLAMQAFNEGNNIGGWLNIFASALNGAAVASQIF